MIEQDHSASLPADFQEAAAAADSRAAPAMVAVSLDVPADVAAWFKEPTQPTDWRHHMAEVLAFYMETNQPAPGRPHEPNP